MTYPILPTDNSSYKFIPITTSTERLNSISGSSARWKQTNPHRSNHLFERTKRVFQALKNHYNDWKEKFKQVAGLFNRILVSSEYLSNNKENISLLFYQTVVKEDNENRVIEKFDRYYKWTNSIAPLSLHLLRYGLALTIEDKLKYIAFTPDESNDSTQPNSSSPNNSEEIDNFNYRKDRFQQTLDRDKIEILNKFGIGLTSLATKTISYALTSINLLSEKVAEKVAKYTSSFFTNIWALKKFSDLRLCQHDWNSLLQPRTFLIGNQTTNTETPEKNTSDSELKAKQLNLSKEFYNFLQSLRSCEKISQVKTLFSTHNLPFPLPRTVDELRMNLDNDAYRSDLAQSFYCQAGDRIAADSDEIANLIERSKEIFDIKKAKSFVVIQDQFYGKLNANPEGLSWEEGEKFFSKLHMTSPLTFLERKIDVFHIPPLAETPRLAWKEAIQDKEYIELISREWVAHQEATAQLIVQGLRQALLCKSEVENKFLVFEAIKNSFKILFSALQLALLFPALSSSTIGSILKVFFQDFLKTDDFRLLNIGCFLYPNLKLKIESIFLLIAKHFFAINYKPNEYSLSGYMLEGQRRMIRFVLLVYSLKFLCHEGLLWVKFNVLNIFSQELERKLYSDDTSYIELNLQREEMNMRLEEYKNNLDRKIKNLKLEDLNLIFKSPSPPFRQEETATTKEVKDNIAIDAMIDALRDADVRFFPTTAITFFETHLGFELTEKSKGDLKEYLESFFTREEGDFIGSFSSNRFNYLNRPCKSR